MTNVATSEKRDYQPIRDGAAIGALSATRDGAAALPKIGASSSGQLILLIARAIRLAVQLTSLCVLSRLLSPDDFGLVGMVVAFTGFLELFKDMGIGAAIVQQKVLPPGLVGALFCIVTGCNLLISLSIVAFGPAFAWFYHDPRLTRLAPLFGAVVFANGMAVIPYSLARRELMFKRLALIDVAAPLVGTIVAIVAALLGVGYWALALEVLSAAVASVALCWILCPRWSSGIAWTRQVRSALWFGGNLSGFNIMNYWARNMDNLLIGRFCGSIQLGIYSRAYSLLTAPIILINNPLSTIHVPMLSRLQDDQQSFRKHYLDALKTLTSLTLPLTFFLFVCSEEVVRVALGSGWSGVTYVFRLLAVAALVQPLCNTTGWIFAALGRTDRMMRWGLFASTLYVISFAIGLPYGAVGVATSYTIVVMLLTIPCIAYALHGTLITLPDVFRSCLPSALGALTVGGLSLAVKLSTRGMVPGWLHDGFVVAAGGLGIGASLVFSLRSRKRAMALAPQPLASLADDSHAGDGVDCFDRPAVLNCAAQLE